MKIGDRILVFWTTRAWDDGLDWVSYEILDIGDDGLWVKGVRNPEGYDHDGCKTFIGFDETLEIMVWKKEEEPAEDLREFEFYTNPTRTTFWRVRGNAIDTCTIGGACWPDSTKTPQDLKVNMIRIEADELPEELV